MTRKILVSSYLSAALLVCTANADENKASKVEKNKIK